jgi:hypothetical protein
LEFRGPGTASRVEPLTISIAVSEYELIGSLEPPVVVAVASEKLTLPKSASEASEHDDPEYVLLQTSGRSTTHSAEDLAAPEKAMEVEKVHPVWLDDESVIASVHSLPTTLTEALIESPEDTGFVLGESSSS